ncbi:MAG TPA: hypothetical protein VJZ00_13155 [Thermoanaerobaculia bacterium]|nr:hypothetical protein [Thermoanaerobaculia bacterium]
MTAGQIAAATFTIAFEGLMMFQTEANGYRNVALVDTDERHKHTAQIEIRDRDGKPREKQILLELGDRVTFEGTVRGEITTDKLYDRHVPHLKKYIIKGDVDVDVAAKTPKPGGALAFVDLPGGAMTTFENFRDRVQLTKHGLFSRKDTLCFSRFVVMETPYSGPTFLVINRNAVTTRHEIRSDDIVIISNISTNPKPHFQLYGQLLAPGGKLGDSEVLEDQKPTCIGEVSPDTPVHVKIVLLDLYRRVPNGDCGPTGNP